MRRAADKELRINSYTGLHYNRYANRRKHGGTNRGNDSIGDRSNYGDRLDSESHGDRPEDQSNNAASQLGQKKRLDRLHEKETHDVQALTDNILPTKSGSGQVESVGNHVSSTVRSRRSSATRSLSTGVLQSRKRKNDNEAREVKAESAGKYSTSDCSYSSDKKKSPLKQHVSTATSTDEADSPRWKSRRAFGQKPVERLQAKTVPVLPFSSGKWRYRVYLLYIWGLCTLSLILFYTFLWRISINELW